MRCFVLLLFSTLVFLPGCGGDRTPQPSSVGLETPPVEDPSQELDDLPVERTTPKTQPARREDDEEARANLAEVESVWTSLQTAGFVTQAFDAAVGAHASDQANGLESQVLTFRPEGLELEIKSGPKEQKPNCGAVSFTASRIRGIAFDLDLSPPAANNLNFVTVVATNRAGGRLGRWRLRLPAIKERRTHSRLVYHFIPDEDLETFEQVSNEATLEGVRQIHLLFQLRPQSSATVKLHRVALLKDASPQQGEQPKPNPDLQVTPVTNFLTSQERPRAEQLAAEIDEIQQRLESHGGSWEMWFDALDPFRQELDRKLEAAGGKPLQLGNRVTLTRLASITHRPGEKWPGPQLNMLTSLDQQLSDRNIDLILVPIPTCEQVFADQFLETPPVDTIVDVYREFLLQSLLRQNLEVIDVRPALRAASDSPSLLYYEGRVSALGDGGVQVVAREIARRLSRYGLEPNVGEIGTATVEFSLPDKVKASAPPGVWSDTYQATKVVRMNGADLPSSNPDSPVLLICDNKLTLPDGFGVASANVAGHLMKETGQLVDTLPIGFSIPQTSKVLAEMGPRVLTNRKVCVLLFSEAVLYQNGSDDNAGWEVVELKPSGDAAN